MVAKRQEFVDDTLVVSVVANLVMLLKVLLQELPCQICRATSEVGEEKQTQIHSNDGKTKSKIHRFHVISKLQFTVQFC